MKVRTKLFIGFAILVTLLWAVGFLSWGIFGNLNEKFSAVEKDIIPDTIAMTEVETISSDIYRQASDYLYHDTESAKNGALFKLNRLEEIRLDYLPTAATSDMTEHVKDAILADQIYNFCRSTRLIIDLKERWANYDTLLVYDRNMMLPPLLAMQERVDELKADSMAELALVEASFEKAYTSGLHSIYLAAILVSILAIAAGIAVTRSIIRPLIELRKGTETIGSGNLAYKVGTNAKDEIGELSRAFDKMTKSLSKSMTSIDTLNQEIAERKLVEGALKESQTFASSLLDNAPHAVVVINPDTSIKYVNPSWEELNGWTSSEIIGIKAPYPWWPDEQKEVFLGGFKEAMAQGSGNAEIIAQKKSGETYWIDMNWASVKHDGELQYLLINSVDITARKQAEEALRETEERFSKAFRASPDIMCITSIKGGKYLEVNESFTRATGYAREEVIGRTTTEVNIWVNPKDRTDMLRKFKHQGRVYNEEYQFRVKSGEAHTMLFSAEKITIGGSPCMLGVCVDITERKKSERLQNDENHVLTLLGQGAALSELLEAIVSLGESYDPAIKGAVMLFDSSKQLLFQAAAPHLPAYYNKLMKNGLPVAPNMGSCGTAAYLKERVIVPDIETSSLFPYKEGAAKMIKAGLRACWSQPIIGSNGGLLGTIANYKTVVGEPSADNLRVLEWSARIAAIAIEHKRAEEAMANEAIWRRILIDESLDGIVVLDEDSKVYEANQRFAEMLGYSPEEVRELHTWDWDTQWTREELLEMGHNVDAEGLRLETYHQRKDGTFIDVDISINGAVVAGKKLIFCVCRDVTARKQADEALRESEERFSKAFHASPDMMAIVNLKTNKYTEVNDSFVHYTGYSRDELIGHTNQEFNMWVDPEEEKRMGRLLDETGQMRHEEFHFRVKSGEIRTWACSADIITIGGDPCMLAVATDITERKEAQEALHESEERFSKAFHASPGSMSISRCKDGVFIEVNEAFLKDKGFTREEVIGHSSAELGIWKDEEHRTNVLQMLQEQGRVRNELTQFRTKTGELRTGYLSAEFINLGNELCMIVLTTDITQLKQAEEQLRLLSSVTQQVSDSTIVIDTNFKITYMNQAAQDLFGYTLEEARGNTLGLFDARPMTRKESEEIRKTITSGKVLNSVSTKRCKDGRTITCGGSLNPLYDDKGEICSYIDVQHDITKEKEVEAKLQVHKQLIERILATMPEGVLVVGNDDRILLANEAFRKIFHTGRKATTNKLLNDVMPVKQLRNLYMTVKDGNEEDNTLEFRYQIQGLENRIACVITKMDSERMLLTFSDVSQEREEEEKLYLTDRLASIGEMAAGLAHELNNPLTGVLALSQLLMDSDLPEEYREDLECVYNEAKRAASIVKNVLLFTRNNHYENGHASTNEVVRDVLRLREYEEKVSNITAITKLQEDIPDVPMDKFQLQQVLLNIILNAEAAIKEANRPGTLSVTTERANNHINIHFQDNGCGIDKHVLPRIFDPFFTTKDIGKGTGLGLSICYGIIAKHGGKISVKTNVNKGTTFTIRMPVVSETV
jgi:PAS domain S-box-containing protein